ncbi:MAG: thioredoxin family protein, partial [Bacteroidales bacterium]|nr:thioredoxin family protein [Bacteroidales bacterium]
ILLDFTAYQAEKSATRNLYFRELYNKYKDRGFEIYQISLDTDENLWKTGASHLPWVCVRDRNSLRSGYLSTYNVQNLPTFFLMDKAGNIVARDAMISDLNKEIQKLL